MQNKKGQNKIDFIIVIMIIILGCYIIYFNIVMTEKNSLEQKRLEKIEQRVENSTNKMLEEAEKWVGYKVEVEYLDLYWEGFGYRVKGTITSIVNSSFGFREPTYWFFRVVKNNEEIVYVPIKNIYEIKEIRK